MKAQSYIIEFILMFLVSFSIFSTISFIFYNQNQSLSNRVGNSTSKLVNDVVAIECMKVISCKACYDINIKSSIPQRIGGFFYKISLTQEGVLSQLTSGSSTLTPVFNLNETFTFSGSVNSNNKKIEIQINNNKIEVK